MAPPKKTIWHLEPHTLGKHRVLRSYLDAWLPIMGKWNGRILFIDGFSGPGEYEGGEEGSPQIAMRALVDHRHPISAEVGFIFIENDKARAEHLAELVESWKSKLPGKSWARVFEGKFDETLQQVLSNLDEQSKRLAPTLLMVDPFGISGTPMNLIQRVLENPKCEVFASLMYESINRFSVTPEFAPHLDALFGTSDWRKCSGLSDANKRQECFYALYEHQLRGGRNRQVVHIDLFQGNRLIYSIFFVTNHVLGCDRMKSAIWKLSPEGDFQFRGVHSDQLTLGISSPDFEPLKQALCTKFRGQGWVTINNVVEFVQSDRTDYHSGQLRRNALVPLESDGRIEVDPDTRTRRNSYPDGCRIRFL